MVCGVEEAGEAVRFERKDRNHGEVVEALRACGCFVVGMGREAGFDLLVGLPGGRGWVAVEVKDGEKAASRRKLTAAELEFRGNCLVKGLPYELIESLEDVVGLVSIGKAGI